MKGKITRTHRRSRQAQVSPSTMGRQNHDKTTFRRCGQLLARRARKDFFVMIGGPCRVWPWHPPGFFFEAADPSAGGRQPQLPAPTDRTGGSPVHSRGVLGAPRSGPSRPLPGRSTGLIWGGKCSRLFSPDQSITIGLTHWTMVKTWPGDSDNLKLAPEHILPPRKKVSHSFSLANWGQHLKNHWYKIHGEAPPCPWCDGLWWLQNVWRLSWVPSHGSSFHYIHS